MTHKIQLEDFILQKRQMENTKLEQLTVALSISPNNTGLSATGTFKGLTWPDDLHPKIVCNRDSCVGILGGWLLRQKIDPKNLTDFGISNLSSMIYKHFGYISDIQNTAGDIISHNLNFFAGIGQASYRGVFFSSYEQFTFHPSIGAQTNFRAAQASLASRTGEDSPLIHIHRVGGPPKNKAEATELVKWLREGTPKVKGIWRQRTLSKGCPYLISIITHEASNYTHQWHEFTPVMLEGNPPKVSFVGLS